MLLEDRHGMLIERLGLVELAGLDIKLGEIARPDGDIGVFGPEGLLEDRQGLDTERDRLGEAALTAQLHGLLVQLDAMLEFLLRDRRLARLLLRHRTRRRRGRTLLDRRHLL